MSTSAKRSHTQPPRFNLGGFDMRTTVKRPISGIPFKDIAQVVLGTRYELSLVVCGDSLARRVNKTYRHKDYAPNVLSFPLNSHAGEIFLNIRKAEREAKQMNISTRKRIAHLYVHGCFHLLGMDHSDEMERKEDTILTRFKCI